MQVRRSATAAIALVAVVVSGARAGGSYSLDGVKHTRVRYTATLTSPAVKVNTERSVGPDLLTPRLADCSTGTCDIRTLLLTLPRNVSGGRFSFTMVAPRTLNVYVSLYDSNGTEVRSVQSVDPNDDDWSTDYRPTIGDTIQTGYVLDFSIPRLAAGRYTLVVYDRGGSGSPAVTVDYTALHPDRAKKH